MSRTPEATVPPGAESRPRPLAGDDIDDTPGIADVATVAGAGIRIVCPDRGGRSRRDPARRARGARS